MNIRSCTIAMAAMASSLAMGAFAKEAPPATKDALAERIRQYHKANDCDGFIDLFYQQGTDSARQAAFIITMTNYVCSNFGRPLDSVAFQDVDADHLKKPKDFKGEHSEYTLRPEGAVVLDYGSPSPGQAESLSLLYGKHDNTFYLIATKQAVQ